MKSNKNKQTKLTNDKSTYDYKDDLSNHYNNNNNYGSYHAKQSSYGILILCFICALIAIKLYVG